MASSAVQASPNANADMQAQRGTQQEEEEGAGAAPTVPPQAPGPRYQYQLLYSKSRVTLHPTPYSKDNIPGYLALLRRHKIRKPSVDSQASSSAGPSSQPLRRQFSTQDNSYDVMLSWLPEELVKDRSETAKFVDVELREAEGASQRGEEETECTVMHSDSGKVLSMREVVENESILVQPPPLASPSTSSTSPASYAFSHPLGMLYSLQATPPTISNWYGSLTICLVGGQTLAPLYFHDDESRTTILGMLRASKAPAYPPTIVSPSAPSPPAWGGDELVQQLKKYAFIHRSVHDHRIFLVNPDPEDLEMHSTPIFADDALDLSPTAARRRQSGRHSGMPHDAFVFPDDPFAPSYGSRASDSGASTPTRDSNRDSFSSWAKTTRMSLLSSFSHVTRSARDASRQILTSPNTAPYAAKLPAAVQSFAQAGPLGPFGPTSDDVSKLSQKAGVMEYDSARVYLAKWARLVAEEGERSKRREEAKGGAVEGGRTSMTEEGGLGGFEILERGSATPLQLTRRYDPVQLVEFQSWFDPHDGRPRISFDEFKSRVFARGLAPSTRKLAWPFLLDVVPWNTSAAERSAYFAEKAEKYRRLKSLWAAEDSPSAQALRGRDDVIDQRHRIRVDCLRTDRKQPMFSSGAKTDGDGGDDHEEPEAKSAASPVSRKASLAGIQSRQAGQGDSTNAHILTLGEVLLTYTFYDTLGPAVLAEEDAEYGKLLEGRRIDEGEVGGYVQGMSDLCAPLYIISEGDEVEAFWSLVGLMKRMRPNFLSSQAGMKTQLLHLQSLIRHADPPLYAHLEQTGSLNLFFCFRWLLVRFKREFPLDEVLRIWECCLALEPSNDGSSGNSSSSNSSATDQLSSAPSPSPSPSARPSTSHLHLFLCLSLLLSNRTPTIEYLDCFDEVLQFFQGLAGHMDVEACLGGAERAWKGLRRRVEEVLEKEGKKEGDEEGEEEEEMGVEEKSLLEIRELVGL